MNSQNQVWTPEQWERVKKLRKQDYIDKALGTYGVKIFIGDSIDESVEFSPKPLPNHRGGSIPFVIEDPDEIKHD